MPDLLFELFSEEIPARMQSGAAKKMLESLERKLGEAGLKFDQSEAFYGPRRLTLAIAGLPDRQEDRIEERKGPKEDASDQAIQGFLRGAGLDSLDDAELRATAKGNIWFTKKYIQGIDTKTALPSLLLELINEHSWPKSQRWAKTSFRWVRPLRRILAVFDGEALKGHLELGGGEILPFTAEAEGHRFLGNGIFQVDSVKTLEKRLGDHFCVLRADERRKRIERQLRNLCDAANLTLIEDDALLEEVAGLTEWPVVVQGNFDRNFLDVPEECLLLSMREHQKYFGARNPNGSLANVFFTVSNMISDDDYAAIRAGNQRVLNARLSDAKFFFEQDLSTPLDSSLPKLENIVFHAKLGSVADKVRRMKVLAGGLAKTMGIDADLAVRAIVLMKADLVSSMVYEFPELQGLMGSYYARIAGEDQSVSSAIAAHYQPAGPSDECPSDPVSCIAALVDKIDTLVGFWLIDQKPTGSKDPFALRRAALGVVRLIRENSLDIDLSAVLTAHVSTYELDGEISDSLINFLIERLAVQLRDEGIRFDVVQAVQGGVTETKINRFVSRVQTTQERLSDDLVAAYKRAANILEKAKTFSKTVSRPLADPADKSFGTELDRARPVISDLMAKDDFGSVFDVLAGLRAKIDLYFDSVMINADDLELRNQRLSLLADFVGAVNEVADLSYLGT